MRPTLRLTTATALATAIMLVITGCGDDDTKKNDAKPTPTQSSTGPSPTADPSAWTKKYSKKQVAAYDAALKRWEAYEKASEPIWAAGKASKSAERLFKKYYPSPAWQRQFSALKTYEEAEVRIEGSVSVFWSRPKSISDNGLNVDIKQCVDYTTSEVTQHGTPAPSANDLQRPLIRTISLSKPDGYDWLIYDVVDSSSDRKPRRCNP